MEATFSDILRNLRIQKNLSQQGLANRLFVSRSCIANWESGRRIPDAIVLSRLADYFGVDASVFFSGVKEPLSPPNIIIVDDEDILLSGELPIVSEAIPGASVIGFTKASEALSFAEHNHIGVAFLDIELGKTSGLSLCEAMTKLQPTINIFFLTGYPDYALRAWGTSACGFLVKPLRAEELASQLSRVKYPVKGLS